MHKEGENSSWIEAVYYSCIHFAIVPKTKPTQPEIANHKPTKAEYLLLSLPALLKVQKPEVECVEQCGIVGHYFLSL